MNLFALYESTKAQFEQLHSQGKRSHYPASLKADVLDLLEHYSAQSLCKAFGICKKSIRNWLSARERGLECKIKLPADTQFATVKLSEPAVDQVIESAAPALTLQLGAGLNLLLPKQSIEHTVKLISALVKELSQCSI